ncbi:aquaporin NIP1-1 [Amborella trichopoda]|uniref:aquaporin NIP1-1 n=1 Tax=Amborella trichopoda TaxID=13333 RepID=UPI0005D43458|nr:aquaporin NIP1-1 [Amborella trichopoda]|eukprot:XP_006853156.2 aquaporin NIP1-1 [Amborella trichopoda]
MKISTLLNKALSFVQLIVGEMVGTYFLIFVGCASALMDAHKHNMGIVGVAISWGFIVMVMIYTIGHVSGGHFNPAVTIAFASVGRFPWKSVPAYVAAQVLGSTLACATLRIFYQTKGVYVSMTLPSGTWIESLGWEFIITFLLMFVICGVATDSRAIGKLSGVAVGGTVLFNVLIAGAVSGASMNPARSMGPAFVKGNLENLWIYLVGPTAGAISGAYTYNLLRPIKVLYA